MERTSYYTLSLRDSERDSKFKYAVQRKNLTYERLLEYVLHRHIERGYEKL